MLAPLIQTIRQQCRRTQRSRGRWVWAFAYDAGEQATAPKPLTDAAGAKGSSDDERKHIATDKTLELLPPDGLRRSPPR